MVVDLVLALVLLAGAGLMLRTVSALVRTSPGFNPDRIVAMPFSLVGSAYAEDTAVVAFRLVGKPAGEGGPALYYLNTGTFVRRDGEWRAVAWQATKVPPAAAP